MEVEGVNRMDSILEKEINKLIQQLSYWLFDKAEGVLAGLEQMIINTSIFKYNQLFLGVSICVLLLFGLKRMIYFLNGRQYQMKGYWKENKRSIVRMGLIFFICLFPYQILEFTFQYWSSFIDDGAIFKQLKESTEGVKGETIYTSMIMVLSSLTALYIALIQFFEVIGLTAVLMLSPIILIMILYKHTLFDTFIRFLTEAVINPISQTLLMYIAFQLFLPAFVNEGSVTLVMQLFLMIGMIFFCLQGAKHFSQMLVIPPNMKHQLDK